jgi:NAD-dependent deacetylase
MSEVERIAAWLRGAHKAVAFTGAGVSTESGIPDFRSPGGVWAQNKPVLYQEYLASAAARYESWRQRSITHAEFRAARPNDGHKVLAQWEREGRIRGVITQNIDGLHQIAGSRRVLELHGTARETACLDCGARFDADPMVRRFLEEDQVPPCPSCGGMLKHATVSFGQPLPRDVLEEAVALAESADVFLAIGSSLVVEPAASLPRIAHRCGARLVILNRDETPLDPLADVVVRHSIGRTLNLIHEAANALG